MDPCLLPKTALAQLLAEKLGTERWKKVCEQWDELPLFDLKGDAVMCRENSIQTEYQLFRCTRKVQWFDRIQDWDRLGHYVFAKDEEEAEHLMKLVFMNDTEFYIESAIL